MAMIRIFNECRNETIHRADRYEDICGVNVAANLDAFLNGELEALPGDEVMDRARKRLQ